MPDKSLLAMLMLLAYPAVAAGQAVELGSGPGFAIDTSDPDDDGVGVFISSFDVAAGSPQDVTIDSLSLTVTGFEHTYLGDLFVNLVFDPGTPADDSDDVFSPVFINVAPPPEIFGDASDLGGDYTFADGGESLWDTAGALGGFQVVPPGLTYRPSDQGTDDAGDPAEVPVSFDATFGGLSSAGTWALVVFDIAPPIDTGSVAGFTIDVVPVPEPAVFGALAATAGLLLARRR